MPARCRYSRAVAGTADDGAPQPDRERGPDPDADLDVERQGDDRALRGVER